MQINMYGSLVDEDDNENLKKLMMVQLNGDESFLQHCGSKTLLRDPSKTLVALGQGGMNFNKISENKNANK